MIRIFETGDNHIGLKYASHEQAAVLASSRVTAFENMVQIANQESCNLFVITGDLFENTYSISKKDIKSILDMLSCFMGTVIVLPGNHDYYDTEVKVWQYFKDAVTSYDNILLLTDYRPYLLEISGEKVILYPALCTSVHSAPGENNLSWIKATDIPNDDTYHIGIAHGAVEGETIDKEGQYFLMTRSELESIPVDVWLLGHKMKIKNLSCTQFAGVRDRTISFADGINVVYGKNESGKSTMANLIVRTLFQKAKLDRRSNREFCDLYFPSTRKGSNLSGDFADGKIALASKDGDYVLSKEWGVDARCTLSTPEGIVRDQAKIDEILKSVLNYGEGVYSDLLLTSQRNTDAALQTLLDASKNTEAKAEITDAVSLAFAESDGVSIDAIEQAMQSKISEISGKHWDIDRGVPARKAGRWSTGLGEILKAYYAMEDLAIEKCDQNQ